MYTNDAAVCDAVSHPLLRLPASVLSPSADPARLFMGGAQWALRLLKTGGSKGGVLGFDIEWRPQFRAGGKQNRTALLQLAAADSVLCLQLAHMRSVPTKLNKLLADTRWVKCGVGILDDCVKLERDWEGVDVRGRVDVGEVYLQHVGATDGHSTACGIKALAADLLHEEISKPKKVSMSNWENLPLNGAQLRYAALDAWVGYGAYVELAKRGAQSKLVAARRDGSTDEEKVEVDQQRARRRAEKVKQNRQKERERAKQGKRGRAAAEESQQQEQQQRSRSKKRRRVIPGAAAAAAAAAASTKMSAASLAVGSPNSRVVVTLKHQATGGAENRSAQAKSTRSLKKRPKKKKKTTTAL